VKNERPLSRLSLVDRRRGAHFDRRTQRSPHIVEETTKKAKPTTINATRPRAIENKT
jgi:hypothetical protein